MRISTSAMMAAVSVLCLAACSEPMPGDAPDAVEAAVAAEEAAEPETASGTAPKLEQLWVAEGFEQPEGAAIGPQGNYFISNVAGDSSAKDGNGFISKVAPDGTILMQRWAEALDAPKGMVVMGDTLYVADIDRVVSFDVHNGTPRGSVTVEGAQFLNDMTVWNGEVLVSDSGTASIHKITPEGAELLGASQDWAGINGLLGDGDRLLIATMAEGKLIDLRSAVNEETLATGMINADGVGLVPGGGYLVSSWPGQIHYVSEEGQVTTLIDTEAETVLQNDLSVFGDVVVVPNMLPGTVTAWRVVRD